MRIKAKQLKRLTTLLLIVAMMVAAFSMAVTATASGVVAPTIYGKLMDVCDIARHVIAELDAEIAKNPAAFTGAYETVPDKLGNLKAAVETIGWEDMTESEAQYYLDKISEMLADLQDDKYAHPTWNNLSWHMGTVNPGYDPKDYASTVISITPTYGEGYLTGYFGEFPGNGHKVTASLSDSDNFEMTLGSSTYIMPVNAYNWPWYTIQPKESLKPGTYNTTLVITVWDPPQNIFILTSITVDYSFIVQAEEYEVTFVDHDGTVLKTETVERGKAATAPQDLTRSGYIFTGWDKAFNYITGDLTVTAQYEHVIFKSAEVISFNKNLQNGNNNNLKFAVRVTMTDGSTYVVDYVENVKGGQKGSKALDYGDYKVSVAWNDNNMVTKCEIDGGAVASPAKSNSGNNKGNGNQQ